VELNFTDDEREQNKEMEIESNVSRKRKQQFQDNQFKRQ
jgi:hypothetical protein